MTAEMIREWSRSLKKHEQEKIARDTPRYLAESNRLCRLVAEDFIGKPPVSGPRHRQCVP
jgi:hypothetical protein